MIFVWFLSHTLQNVVLITDFLLFLWPLLTIAALPPGVTKLFDQLNNLGT